MDKSVLIENNEGFVTLTINRPKALNAINEAVMTELNTFFKENSENKSLVGVIITGSGDKAFAAGADIKEFEGLSVEAGSEKSRFGHETYFRIEQFHVPVIAAVNGFCLGGGCELAMACHLRVAGETARFGQPEVNLGLIPGYGGTQRLIQLVGKGKAMELLLTADMVKAHEAERLGLANCVVPQGEEVNKAREILEKVATKGPVAISKIIESVNNFYNDKYGFEQEVKDFGTAMASEEAKEGAAAFVEKRKANFKRG